MWWIMSEGSDGERPSALSVSSPKRGRYPSEGSARRSIWATLALCGLVGCFSLLAFASVLYGMWLTASFSMAGAGVALFLLFVEVDDV